MPLPVFHVDAFTARPLAGNPAAVCPLAGWLDDGLLRAVAAENNLSETAYLVPRGHHYELRWFTPRCEVKLCGHATLASAFVVLQILETERDTVRFETRFSGALTVSRDRDLFAMDFPALHPWTCADPPAALIEGLGKAPGVVVQIEDNYFAATKLGPGWGVQNEGATGGPNRFGYAIEASGVPGTVSGNTIIGSWAEDVSCMSIGINVTDNKMYGDALWHDIAGEPGPDEFGTFNASNNL